MKGYQPKKIRIKNDNNNVQIIMINKNNNRTKNDNNNVQIIMINKNNNRIKKVMILIG